MTTMKPADCAMALSAASADQRAHILRDYRSAAGVDLAHELKALYFASYNSAPQAAAGAAAALAELAAYNPQPEIAALAAWTSGMAALQLEGKPERAIEQIDGAAAAFEALGQPQNAAATQVSKLYALAILGRYEQAIDCGLRARAVFLEYGDALAAGKIEVNLGNLYHRRDQYAEAEQFYRSARERFLAIGDQRLLVSADNGLANVLSLQHQFGAAAELYEQALKRAEQAGLEVARAEIECNLGNLELFQGHYDRALGFLERSRRRYADLGMRHESAAAEQELADAYLALNLMPEAAAIYTRITRAFADLGMQAEQARAQLNHGYACLALGQHMDARALLLGARALYDAEGNQVGAAQVLLAESQLAYIGGDYRTAALLAEQAEPSLVAVGAVGRLLLARLLCGEAYRALGRYDLAQPLLNATLHEAEQHGVPQISQRCHTALGLLAAARGEIEAAKMAFERAAELIEIMRAPLPADEFRTAFIADKLTPYAELARLCLDDRGGARVAQAFGYIERDRAHALLDLLDAAGQPVWQPRDAFEQRLIEQLETLRAELNWLYNQINRPFEGDPGQYPAALAGWQAAAREREIQLGEITRQLQQGGPGAPAQASPIDIAELQRVLGHDTVLIEYFELGDELAAFVVTADRVHVARQLGSMRALTATVEQFRFQIGTFQHGAGRVQAHLAQLITRIQVHLAQLYNVLLRPIEPWLAGRRLVIVPHRSLYYLPFQALYDGVEYLIDRFELCYAPSARILQRCIIRPRPRLEHALICGIRDARSPRVHDEVHTLAGQFARATILLDQQATIAALHEQAPRADLLHIACHGHFRPDNPLFSALELADGQLTVGEAAGLKLECELVTLSACETGVSTIAPGNEMLGLARGFFAAGAPSLLLSLWPVEDEATTQTMEQFYTFLLGGMSSAAALRQAQLAIRATHPHPFFWAAFVLLGRW